MELTVADLKLVEKYVVGKLAPWLTEAVVRAESDPTPELEEEVLGTLSYAGDVLARLGRTVEIKRQGARDQRELARLREEP